MPITRYELVLTVVKLDSGPEELVPKADEVLSRKVEVVLVVDWLVSRLV